MVVSVPLGTVAAVPDVADPGVPDPGATAPARVSSAELSRAEVARLARLARLAVTDAELDVFAGQLSAVLDAVAQVQAVAADDVPGTSHVLDLVNVARPDKVRPSLDREAVLAAAPQAEGGRFRVPRILDEEV